MITEAWVRVQPKPEHRASRAVRFGSFAGGAEAVRELAQSGLRPSNCRLIDALEARQTGAGDGTTALLVLGFESPAQEVDHLLDAGARDLPRARRGVGTRAPAGVGAWRDAFLRAPYLRDMFVQMGVLSDTFETAITWERFPAFHEQVAGATRAALGEPCRVSCRFTHVYPDGPAPYYTVIAPARRGDEVEQWDEIKAAASDAIIAAGGTITHHHAVGRDHRPWYDRQRPEPVRRGAGRREGGGRPARDPQPGGADRMSAEMVEAVRRSMEAWNAHDADAFVASAHPDVVWHPGSTGALTGSDTAFEGREGIRRWWNEMHEAFDSLHNEVREVRLVTQDAALVLGTGHARGRGAGVPVDWEYSMLVEFRDGLMVRGRSWFGTEEGIRAADALAQSRDPS